MKITCPHCGNELDTDDSLTKWEAAVYDVIGQMATLTTVAEATGFHKDRVRITINKLISKGRVEIVEHGSGRKPSIYRRTRT